MAVETSPLPESATVPGCGVTVLRTVGGARATKRWRWNLTLQEWGKTSYEAGSKFTAAEYPVSELAGLVAVLEQVQADARAFVVRGALTDAAREILANDPNATIRRRKHLKPSSDAKPQEVKPTLLEVDRSWIMLDIDGWPLPPWGDLADDPALVIEHAVHALLPPAFHDATCWWQLSASAGFAAGFLKCHLFFWLSQPASNAHIKATLREHAPGVDTAPFSAAQPHYIAAPVIEGGHDPLPRRTGWRRGLDAVVVLPALSPHPQPQPRPAGTRATGRSGGISGALAYLGKGEGGQGFHAPLRAAVLRYAKQAAHYGDRDDEAFKAQLRQAIRAAPRNPGDDVETPYCQDYYLNSSIAGAFGLLAGETEVRAMRPHHAERALSAVETARAEIAAHVTGFFDRALAWHGQQQAAAPTAGDPEHAALAVGVGLGKSTAVRNDLPSFIEQAKADGKPHRVLYLVPTHRLGGEAETEMRKLGLSVAVWRGREAADPASTPDPETGKPELPMCLNLPAVMDALAAGYDVEAAACGKVAPGKASCPYHGLRFDDDSGCAYQRAKGALALADVIIASHQALFRPLLREVASDLGAVVVDEAFWQAGLHPNAPTRLCSFADEPASHPVRKTIQWGDGEAKRVVVDDECTNDLMVLARWAQNAFETIPDGELVSREAVEAVGLTPDDCAAAIKWERRRKLEGKVFPGMGIDARRQGVEEAAGNASIPRRVGIWHALLTLLQGNATHTGCLQMGMRLDKAGGAPERVVLLHSRHEVRDDILALPVLLLDATMPVEVVRRFMPRLEVLADIQAAAPYMQVHQIVGGWGKSSLVPSPRQDETENNRRRNLVRELADFVRLHSGGGAFAVTYEAIESAFAAPEVRTGHFNAIAGLDTFGDVASLFVIGRPLPDMGELRAMALALTGEAIEPESGSMQTRGARMADGTGAGLSVRAYENPALEALRTAIMDAEVVQAIGRGRGVNRTAETPLQVFVMADVALPLPLNSLTRWADVRPSVLARMLGRGAVYLGATDAAKAYPDLFCTADAAKKALQRAGAEGYLGDIPLSILNHRGLSPKSLIRVAYRPHGRGQQTRTVLVRPEVLEGLEERLVELVGPLAHYAVCAAPPPNPSASRPETPQPVPPADDMPPDLPDDPGWTPDAEPAEPAWARERTLEPAGEVPGWGMLPGGLAGQPERFNAARPQRTAASMATGPPR